MEGLSYRISPFYENLPRHPELAKFRRFTSEWSWLLNQDIGNVLQHRRLLDEAMQAQSQSFSALDYHHIYMKEKDKELDEKTRNLQKSLRRYGKDVILASNMIVLPDQPQVYARYLSREYPRLFVDGKYTPTGEEAEIYQESPQHPDTCVLKPTPKWDIFSGLIINNSQRFEDHVFRHLRRLFRGKKSSSSDIERNDRGRNLPLDTVNSIMDYVTCVFVPVLLTISMVVLHQINRIPVRILVNGVFGLIFAFAVKGLAGHPTRGEVCAATAAYFAVSSIFLVSSPESS